MLNTISTILPFLVCLFWTAVLLLEWKESYPAKHLLTAFMGVSTVLYFCHAIFFTNSILYLRIANSIYTLCTVAVFPLFYLYILRLTTLRVNPRNLLILAPAVILGLAATVINFSHPFDSSAHKLLKGCVRTVFTLQLIPICYLGYKKLKAFDVQVENLYSETDRRSMKYIKKIILLLIVCSIFSATSNYLGRDFFYENKSILIIPSAVFSTMLFFIGYCGIKQGFCIDYLKRDLNDTNKAVNVEHECELIETKHHGENSQLLKNLSELMDQQRLYLHNDIRLVDVAKQLGVSRNLLSSLINSNYGVSFSDYINGMRIEYAKDMMLDMSHTKISQLAISEQSGFTSESSFYRAFKKHTGTTPKQWLASLN